MTNLVSKHLNAMAVAGLRKVGDILIPGDGDLPKFSDLALEGHIDRMIDFMPKDDRDGLVVLLAMIASMPTSAVVTLLRRAEKAENMSGPIGETLRLVNLGLKGPIYTLYFSDLTPGGQIRKALNWNTKAGAAETFEATMELTPVGAFAKARNAEAHLASLAVPERLAPIARLRAVIMERQSAIIDTIVQATGKSRSDALMSEISPVLDTLTYIEKTAVRALRDKAVSTPLALLGKKSWISHEPLGVVLSIVPWNYPFCQVVVPAAFAIACGNPVVCKPSEYTPMRGLVEDLLQEARFPDGWLNLVYGDGKVGSELIEQRPEKIFFIGSTRTGKRIAEQAAKHLIAVELELGGKDPMVVFADANIERVVAGALWGGLTNSGQSCTSVERLYLEESIYAHVKQRLVDAAVKITVGEDHDGSVDMGRMTVAAQVALIAEQLADAEAKGARILCGGSWDRKSLVIPPIIIEGITRDMRIHREETFGPVIALYSFMSEAEAIEGANDSDFGLSASVWSANTERALRVAKAIKTGNVSINNVMLTEGNPHLPFGGTKQSGYGRYKGTAGFHAFCNIKSMLQDGNSSKIEAHWYPFSVQKYKAFEEMMQGLLGEGAFAKARFAKAGMALESMAPKAWKERIERS